MGIELLSRHIGMRDTKSNITSLIGVLEEQAIAYATDTLEIGIYTNGAWIWISPLNNLYIDQSGGTADTYGVLGCTLDGAHPICTVSQGSYVSGELLVFLNGQLQTQGTAEDWVETDPATGTFTFAVAPNVPDEITVIYGFLGVGVGTGYTQGARVSNNANIALTNGADTLLTFNTEVFDTDTIHDAGVNPGRLTCKTPGIYIIGVDVKFTTGAANIQLMIKFNGTGAIIAQVGGFGTVSAGPTLKVAMTTIYALTANQYVEAYAYVETNSINAVYAAEYSPVFWMQRIG